MCRALVCALMLLPPAACLGQDTGASPKNFREENKAWLKVHPYPKRDAPRSEQEHFDQELAQASGEWVRHWPDDPLAWQWRLSSLAKVPNTTNEDLEKAGDALLNALEQHPFRGVLMFPFQTSVAQVWNGRGLRLAQCVELAKQALSIIDENENANPTMARMRAAMFLGGRAQTLAVEADAARKLKDFNTAGHAVAELKRLSGQSSNFGVRYQYLAEAARLAEAEGHKADALLYYRLLLTTTSAAPEDKKLARDLWKQTGGTEEGFKIWSSPEQQDNKAAVSNDATTWTQLSKPIAPFLGRPDLNGKVWSIGDLKGKRTIVIVWATWCPPCREEMPVVEKFFQSLQKRSDLQLITLNVDKDSARAQKFVTDNHLDLPIIPADLELIDTTVGQVGLPRVWVVDGSGNVRLEQVGYKASEWPAAILSEAQQVQPE
jgi:thiol-disulfide isomerase/thioredoxin